MSSKTLLFVCTGNTCRSPMAEHLMRALCGGAFGWGVSSAGLAAMDGEPASEQAQNAMREKGLDLSGHRARRLRTELVAAADLIVTMTDAHRMAIAAQWPAAAARTRTLHQFGSAHPQRDVLDPVGGSLDTYRLTRDEIERALADLILSLRSPGAH